MRRLLFILIMSWAGGAAGQDIPLPSRAEVVPPPSAASPASVVPSIFDIVSQKPDKWGHLAFGSPSSWAINVPPGGRINVCGSPYTQTTVKAVRAWAIAAGRDKDLSIRISCDSGYTISLTEQCDGQGTPAWAEPSNRRIMWCSSYMSNIVTPVVIHEVGHLWGMCDQYAELNCDYYHRTSYLSGGAIMGASSPSKTRLTADDVTGILNLAERTEAPSNALWKAWLSEQAAKAPDSKDRFQAKAELLNKAAYLRLSASGDITSMEVQTGAGWLEAPETEARTGKDIWITKRLMELAPGWDARKNILVRFTFRDGSTAEKVVDLLR